jgi:hypothetical protein
VAFDGDPSFPFKVHGIEDLIPEKALLHEARALDQAIGQGGFPVVNVGDDAEVAELCHDGSWFLRVR